jgi:hypothetical protein
MISRIPYSIRGTPSKCNLLGRSQTLGFETTQADSESLQTGLMYSYGDLSLEYQSQPLEFTY